MLKIARCRTNLALLLEILGLIFRPGLKLYNRGLIQTESPQVRAVRLIDNPLKTFQIRTFVICSAKS